MVLIFVYLVNIIKYLDKEDNPYYFYIRLHRIPELEVRVKIVYPIYSVFYIFCK